MIVSNLVTLHASFVGSNGFKVVVAGRLVGSGSSVESVTSGSGVAVVVGGFG